MSGTPKRSPAAWASGRETIDIAPQMDLYFAAHPTAEPRPAGQQDGPGAHVHPLRLSRRGRRRLILGTSNKTELLIGYGTVHGDMACAINPLGDLYKTQVRELAAHLGVPAAIREKAPTAGLWPGQTDEGDIGLAYEELDAILYGIVEDARAAGGRRRRGTGRPRSTGSSG